MRALTEKSKNKKTLVPIQGNLDAKKPSMKVNETSPGSSKVRLDASLNSVSECTNCGVESKCRRRSFSEQAWTVLLLWNEISPASVDQPVCEACYEEMRNILIDRMDEIESAMNKREEVEKIRKTILRLAG
ncbi:MAG: hypothetical protein KA436_06700 [Oligoflexales bacterium]|nr:hypothetical protein [Oligoflexales bacterium]